MKLTLPGRTHLWILLGFVFIVFLADFFKLVNFREAESLDLRFRLRGERPGHQDLLIVQIDDSSIQGLGQWPWPRKIHAAFLSAVTRYEPRVVFFDVLFTENSPTPDDDIAFAHSLEKSGNAILPFYFSSLDPIEIHYPIPEFRKHIKATGYVNADPSRDGAIRKIKAWVEGTESGEKKRYENAAVVVSGQKAPAKEFWINYPGSIESFKRISYAEVLASIGGPRDREMRELFEDRIVLIGDVATGSSDLKRTPFSLRDPGVSVQASAMHTLLNGEYLHFMPGPISWFFILLLSFGASLLQQNTKPGRGVLVLLGIVSLYLAICFGLFALLGFILPMVIPPFVMIVSYVLMLFSSYVQVRFQGELMAREIQTAVRIQNSFLPQGFPKLNNLDIYYECRFAKKVGGDFYDYVDLGDGKVGVCVGDVSGKGVPAALYMARAISDLRRDNQTELQPEKVCMGLNSQLLKHGAAGMFLTMIYVIMDTKNRKLSFCNAGHDPMMLYRGNNKTADITKTVGGGPLGIFDGIPYDSLSLPFEPGDVFMLTSDGIKERRDPKKEEFGLERFKTFLENKAGQKSAKDLVGDLFHTLDEFGQGTPAHDDSTVLCARFLK